MSKILNRDIVLIFIGILIVFSAMNTIIAPGSDNSNSNVNEWSMFARSLNHSGFTNAIAPVNISTANRSNYTAGNTFASPIVANGFVYAGSEDGQFYQLNASNVSILVSNYSLIEASTTLSSTPAATSQYVYFPDSNGILYQFNASNVSQFVGFFNVSNVVTIGSPAVVNDSVYIQANGYLYRLNATNVSQHLQNFSTASCSESPSFSNISIFVSCGTVLYELNISNMSQQIKNYTQSASASSSASLSSKFVYITFGSGTVFQLNISNISQQIANFTDSGGGGAIAPVIGNENAYVSVGTNTIYQVNSSNISQVLGRNTALSTSPTPYPIAGNNASIFSSSNGALFYQLNASNISFTIATLSLGTSGKGVAISGGFVYVAAGSVIHQIGTSNPLSDPFQISICPTTLSTANSQYNLTRNIQSNGTCISVVADNITIDGKGFSITGNLSGYAINATNTTGNSWTNLTVKNISITNFSKDIVSITADELGALPAHYGGNVYLINSNLTSIETAGLNGAGNGGSGGNITIVNSNVTTINSSGGPGSNIGGAGGKVLLFNSSVNAVYSYSGDSQATNTINGGPVYGNNSFINIIYSFAGTAGSADAGHAGEVILINTTANKIIAYGGKSDTNGGNGAQIIIQNYSINLTNTIINISRGVGGTTNGSNGKLTINYSSLFVDTNSTYGEFLQLVLINRSAGEIRWNVNLNATTLCGKLGVNTSIRNNTAYADSVSIIGINQSANITFYGLPLNITNATILKDGALCTTCSNFTNLSAGTVRFNVTGWSTYTINGTFTDYVPPVVNISSPTATTYTTNSYLINISINKQGVCRYSLDAGVTNNSLSSEGGLNLSFSTTLSSVSNGDYVLRAYCNDTAGNTNLTTNVSYTVSVSTGTGGGDPPGGSGGSVLCTSFTYTPWSECINGQQTRTVLTKNPLGCTGGVVPGPLTQSCSITNNTCIPNWECSDWNACTNGKSERTCTDKNNCNIDKPETETTCKVDKCVPNIQCGNYAACNYNYKIDDVLAGKISYTGHQDRDCSDLNKCIDGYSESISCSSHINVKLIEQNVCGKQVLTAINADTNNTLLDINLETWNGRKLDLTFKQSSTECSSCYNGIRDGNETGIDCGGSCKVCAKESLIVQKSDKLVYYLIWILLILGFLILFLIISRKKDKLAQIRQLIREGRKELVNNRKDLASITYKQIKNKYNLLNDQDKKIIHGEIVHFHDEIMNHRGFY